MNTDNFTIFLLSYYSLLITFALLMTTCKTERPEKYKKIVGILDALNKKTFAIQIIAIIALFAAPYFGILVDQNLWTKLFFLLCAPNVAIWLVRDDKFLESQIPKAE